MNTTTKQSKTIKNLISELEEKLIIFKELNEKHFKMNESIEPYPIIEGEKNIEKSPYKDLGIKENLTRCLKDFDFLIEGYSFNVSRTSELLG